MTREDELMEIVREIEDQIDSLLNPLEERECLEVLSALVDICRDKIKDLE